MKKPKPSVVKHRQASPAKLKTESENVIQLQRRYDFGREIKLTRRKKFDRGISVLRLAERRGLERTDAYKAIIFAKKYSKNEFRSLVALCKKHEAFGWHHVACLLHIEDTSARSKLQLQAAKENWSIRKVNIEAQILNGGKLTPNQRRPRPETSLAAALQVLVCKADSWTRFYRDLRVKKNDVAEGVFDALDKEPAENFKSLLGEQLDNAMTILKTLSQSAGKAVRRIKKVRKRIEENSVGE